jgi:hypothetical protein
MCEIKRQLSWNQICYWAIFDLFSILNLVTCCQSRHSTFQSSKCNTINTAVFCTRTEVEMRKLVCFIVAVLLPMTSYLALTVSSATLTVEPQVRSFGTAPQNYEDKSILFSIQISLEHKIKLFLIKAIFTCFQTPLYFVRHC